MQILLVEDDLPLGSALSQALQQAGYRCTWVRCLRDGWAHLLTDTHAALLLDLQLPDGEGLQLLQRLRQRARKTPVLILTARDALDDRLRGLNEGADDYLVKPFAVSELLARLLAVLRRSADQASNDWQLGPLSLNLPSRSAQLQGHPLALTRREFDTLVELARWPGQVVHRAQLVQRVWGLEADISDGALDVHMHGLRRKLAPLTVHTVRGVGYCLRNG